MSLMSIMGCTITVLVFIVPSVVLVVLYYTRREMVTKKLFSIFNSIVFIFFPKLKQKYATSFLVKVFCYLFNAIVYIILMVVLLISYVYFFGTTCTSY